MLLDLQAAAASAVSFLIGGVIPLLGGVFITDPRIRLAVVAVSITYIFAALRACSGA